MLGKVEAKCILIGNIIDVNTANSTLLDPTKVLSPQVILSQPTSAMKHGRIDRNPQLPPIVCNGSSDFHNVSIDSETNFLNISKRALQCEETMHNLQNDLKVSQSLKQGRLDALMNRAKGLLASQMQLLSGNRNSDNDHDIKSAIGFDTVVKPKVNTKSSQSASNTNEDTLHIGIENELKAKYENELRAKYEQNLSATLVSID